MVGIDHLLPLFSEAVCGRKTAVSTTGGMVITGHPVATRIAVDVLNAGGNAADAAVAASLSEVVIEPHLSSLMGGFSMLYYDAAGQGFRYLNGNVNAPSAPLDGLGPSTSHAPVAVTVPGYWAAVETAVADLGSRPLADLMAPTIALAEDGFPIYPGLWGEMFMRVDTVARTQEGRDIYFRDGTLLDPGETLRQPALARTLHRLAEEGSDFFYRGAFAQVLCQRLSPLGGMVTPKDMAAYRVRWDDPVRGRYRGHDVIASPAPDVGGVYLLEMLNVLDGVDLAAMGHPVSSPDTLELLTRLTRMTLDRGADYGDPACEPLPMDSILSPRAADLRRAELLDMLARFRDGSGQAAGDGAPTPAPGSCHVTIIDGAGNIASVLHSQYCLPWGTGLFVDGVSISTPGCHFLRHRPPPGGRASIQICPNMFFKDGRPVLVSGSPSLSLIPAIVQCTTALLDFGMSIEETVHQPRFGGYSDADPSALMIEAGFPAASVAALKRSGQALVETPPWNARMGAFEGIYIDDQGIRHACGDPRRTSLPMALDGGIAR